VATLYLGLLRGGWRTWADDPTLRSWETRHRIGRLIQMLCPGDRQSEEALTRCLWGLRDARLATEYRKWLFLRVAERVDVLRGGVEGDYNVSVAMASFEQGLMQIARELAAELALKENGT